MNGSLSGTFGNSLQSLYNEFAKYDADFIDAPFLRNHDMDRIAKVFNDDDKTRLAAEALMFLPGNPYIYYGDELGMLGTRTNFLWGDYYDSLYVNHDDRNIDTVTEQLSNPASLLNTYIELGNVRTNSLALMYGNFIPYSYVGLEGFYRVFEQGQDNEIVLVLFNFSAVYTRPIPSTIQGYEILYSSHKDNTGGISPKGTMVIRLPYDDIDLYID